MTLEVAERKRLKRNILAHRSFRRCDFSHDRGLFYEHLTYERRSKSQSGSYIVEPNKHYIFVSFPIKIVFVTFPLRMVIRWLEIDSTV